MKAEKLNFNLKLTEMVFMKRIILFVVLSVTVLWSYSQNPIVHAAPMLVDTIAERLVAMAIENAPEIKSAQNLATASKYAYKRQKTEYLDIITIRGNVNEFTINPDKDNFQNLYPRYNFGIVFPLGIFVNLPKQTKAAYYQYQAKEEDANTETKEMRKQVLSLYHDYVMNLKLKDIQTKIVNDYELMNSKYEDKFKSGQLSLEDFTNANMQYYNAITRQAGIERDLGVTKAGLEALIGMNLDQAIFQILSEKSKVGK